MQDLKRLVEQMIDPDPANRCNISDVHDEIKRIRSKFIVFTDFTYGRSNNALLTLTQSLKLNIKSLSSP